MGCHFANTIPHTFFSGDNSTIGHTARFSATFVTAIPVDLMDSCTDANDNFIEVDGLVGLYDHDYHSTNGNTNKIPEFTISSASRVDYINALENNGNFPSFTEEKKYELNGILNHSKGEVSHSNGVPLGDGSEVHANAWEMLEYTFRTDRVYQIKFSNIGADNFTQVRVPFDAISAMQSCEADPVIEIDCKNGILFFSKLEWEENPDARLEVKLVDPNTTPPADITFISYTSIATGLISNVSYTQSIYIQGDYSNSDPPDNDSIILKLVDPDNQRNVNAANRRVLVNDRVLFLTGRYSLPDPNNPGLYLPLEPDDPNDGLEPAEFDLTVIATPECVSEDTGEVKIEASGCRIYVSHLFVNLPSLGIDYLPDVRLSIPSSPITTVDLSQPTPPPDADIELFLFDGNDPVDQARMATILGYNVNNYRITHYQDNGGTWQALAAGLVRVEVDPSGLDCPPDDPPNPCTLTDPRIFSGITGPGGNSGRTIRSKTQSSTIPGNARNWSHWHYRWEDTDGDPNTPDVRVRDWLDSGTSIRERGVSDNINVTFSDFDAVLTLAPSSQSGRSGRRTSHRRP